MAITRIQYRRDTTSNWTYYNPVLAPGEPGYDLDLLTYKVGDGVTPWLSLPEFEGPPGAIDSDVTAIVQVTQAEYDALPVKVPTTLYIVT